MENLKLSNSVLEQLAFDLVGEMAEVAKHQAIIDNIKQIIVNEKTRVIKEVVEHSNTANRLRTQSGGKTVLLFQPAITFRRRHATRLA